jgi:transposase
MTIMIGIDPHKGSHTAVAIDGNETVLDEVRVRSCSTQTTRLRDWADRFEARMWAVESAQGLGYLLAQQLVAAGENVIDVPPVRASRVRVLGSGRSQKNDPNDARSVAIAALRADDLAIVRADDHSRVLRLLSKRHRDLGRLKNKACCRLHALLLEMVPGGAGFRIEAVTRVNALIDGFEPVDEMGRQRQEIAQELAADIDRYNQLLDASRQRIRTAVAASATSLTSICGVGPITAAMIIGESGNIDRFASKHHFASYNATAPIEASSGNRTRHRLNPRGNRRLNWAIHVVAVSQLRHDTIGRAYYDRKLAEG